MTVAGGNGLGNAANQLNCPHGLFVDDDGTIVIADALNHRIMRWKKDDTTGRTIAGGNGSGRRLDQLAIPTDVLLDKQTNSLIMVLWYYYQARQNPYGQHRLFWSSHG